MAKLTARFANALYSEQIVSGTFPELVLTTEQIILAGGIPNDEENQ